MSDRGKLRWRLPDWMGGHAVIVLGHNAAGIHVETVDEIEGRLRHLRVEDWSELVPIEPEEPRCSVPVLIGAIVWSQNQVEDLWYPAGGDDEPRPWTFLVAHARQITGKDPVPLYPVEALLEMFFKEAGVDQKRGFLIEEFGVPSIYGPHEAIIFDEWEKDRRTVRARIDNRSGGRTQTNGVLLNRAAVRRVAASLVLYLHQTRPEGSEWI